MATDAVFASGGGTTGRLPAVAALPARPAFVRRVLRRATSPVDAASVVAFRVLFGALLVVAVARFFAHGWIDAHYVVPGFFFSYFGFEWVRPLPGFGMHALFVVMALSAVGVAAGAFYRASAAVLFATFTYAHLCDQTYYLNHYYLVSCLAFLLVVLPLGGAGSLDARWGRTAAESTVPTWVIWVLRAQVGLVYFFAGVGKLGPDWLLHGQPLRIWLGAHASHPLFGIAAGVPWIGIALSWAGALFDLTVPALLLSRRARPYAFAVLLAFHAATAELFQIGLFPFIMSAAALILFPPDWPRRFAARLGWGRAVPDDAPRSGEQSTAAQTALPSRWSVAPLAVYFALQVLVPLRAALYPGVLNWTEQGFRFAWRVMVVEKSGVAEFRVREPDMARTFLVEPRKYLTLDQVRMMSTQPDMILAFAHHVARDFEARGVKRPEVRADVFVSLDGRPATRLVDPDVDLAREREGFGPKRWLLSAPEGPPP